MVTPNKPADIFAVQGEWYLDRYWISRSYVYRNIFRLNDTGGANNQRKRFHYVKISDAWEPNTKVIWQSPEHEDAAYAAAVFARLTTDMAATLAAIALNLDPIGDLFE